MSRLIINRSQREDVKTLAYCFKDAFEMFGLSIKPQSAFDLMAISFGYESFNVFDNELKGYTNAPYIEDLWSCFSKDKLNEALLRLIKMDLNESLQGVVAKLIPILAEALFKRRFPIIDKKLLTLLVGKAIEMRSIWVPLVNQSGDARSVPYGGVEIIGWLTLKPKEFYLLYRHRDAQAHKDQYQYSIISFHLFIAYMQLYENEKENELFQTEKSVTSIRQFYAENRKLLMSYFRQKAPWGGFMRTEDMLKAREIVASGSIFQKNKSGKKGSNKKITLQPVGYTTNISPMYEMEKQLNGDPDRPRRTDTNFIVLCQDPTASNKDRELIPFPLEKWHKLTQIEINSPL